MLNSFLSSLVLFSICFAVTSANANDMEKMTMQELALQPIAYALTTQIQGQDSPYYIRGEWPTLIRSTVLPALVGIGKLAGRDDEATAFTTASVVTILGRVYMDTPELRTNELFQKISAAIENAVSTFKRYGDGVTYNFYPPLLVNGVMVHQPVHMRLADEWRGLTNVPNDADTTSVVQSALVFNGLINGNFYSPPAETFSTFSEFKDVNREPMAYNKKENLKDTSAFMTWFQDEKSPDMPRDSMAKPEAGPRIPFSTNDVDCVVNANIFRLKALAQKTDLDGYAESCKMIDQVVQKDLLAQCGIYYPNSYNLIFSMVQAEQAGDHCLSDSAHAKLVSKLLATQDVDGAWRSDDNMWRDPVISTAFAMDSLLQLGDTSKEPVSSALLKGTHYLLTQGQMKKHVPLHWPSDGFFTATARARSLIVWRSEAYTNSIVGAVLLKMHQKFPQYEVHKYLSMRLPSVERVP